MSNMNTRPLDDDMRDDEIRIVGEEKIEQPEAPETPQYIIDLDEESAFGSYAVFHAEDEVEPSADDCAIEYAENNESAIHSEDAEVRVIGENASVPEPSNTSKPWRWAWLIAAIAILSTLCLIYIIPTSSSEEVDETPIEPYYQTETLDEVEASDAGPESISLIDNIDNESFIEIRDTVVNDVALRIYIPHNAEMSLIVGRPDENDTDIIYLAEAADVRADNREINGQFVMNGEVIARGRAKKGFCASINGVVSVGVAEDTTLFADAIENHGYFFRQYPLVKDGWAVKNKPKNKSIRRGICERNGEIFMVETLTRESFHDFSQALVDIGVQQAVNLVGSVAKYGWVVDRDGVRHSTADETTARGYTRSINFMVWRRK